MKMNCILKPARILNHFGHAPLIKRVDGKHELVGGSEGDFHPNLRKLDAMLDGAGCWPIIDQQQSTAAFPVQPTRCRCLSCLCP